jgi:hypothetical protein
VYRRLTALETEHLRKLTAGEYAIVVQSTTGRSVEQWQKDGYVIHACPCDKVTCKGWNMTPLEHHRMAAKPKEAVEPPSVPVAASSSSPPVLAAPKERSRPTSTVATRQAVFQQMFAEGKLREGKKGSTIIPKDGPMTWSHDEQLAFAQGFEMTELLALEGQPRELQRKLIVALRELGYDVLSGGKKKA